MLKGKGISEGIGIGNAVVLKKQEIKIEKIKIEDIDEELKKLELSLESVIKDTKKLKDNSNDEQKKILEAYIMILKDEMLMENVKELIKNIFMILLER